MIPKKIHYCWFGGKPLSQLTLDCIASWKKYMPEYQIIEWNETNYDVNLHPFSAEAYENKKYAFVSDICRLEILYKFGGIYLDTDMELLKPVDCRSGKVVVGFEDEKYVAAGIILAPSSSVFIKSLFEKYDTLKFHSELKDITIPKIITKELALNGLKLNNHFQEIGQIVDVYPSEYFYPLSFFTGNYTLTTNTVAIHHYASSWMTAKQKNKNKFKIFIYQIFGTKFVDNLYRFLKR